MDYMVMEAVCIRVNREDEKQRKADEKAAKAKEFKSSASDLLKYT